MQIDVGDPDLWGLFALWANNLKPVSPDAVGLTPQGKIVLASIFPLDSGTQNRNESWHGTRFFLSRAEFKILAPKTVVLYQTVKLDSGTRFWLKFWNESWHGTHRDTDTCDGGGLQHEIR